MSLEAQWSLYAVLAKHAHGDAEPGQTLRTKVKEILDNAETFAVLEVGNVYDT